MQPLGHDCIYTFMDPSEIATQVGRRPARAEALYSRMLGLANEQRLIVPWNMGKFIKLFFHLDIIHLL